MTHDPTCEVMMTTLYTQSGNRSPINPDFSMRPKQFWVEKYGIRGDSAGMTRVLFLSDRLGWRPSVYPPTGVQCTTGDPDLRCHSRHPYLHFEDLNGTKVRNWCFYVDAKGGDHLRNLVRGMASPFSQRQFKRLHTKWSRKHPLVLIDGYLERAVIVYKSQPLLHTEKSLVIFLRDHCGIPEKFSTAMINKAWMDYMLLAAAADNDNSSAAEEAI